MQAWNELVLSLAQPCRLATEIGLTVLLRSGIMLAAVLVAGFFLRGRHPAVRANCYKVGLAAVSLLCLITVVSLGRGPARWTFSLTGRLPSGASSNVNAEAVEVPDAADGVSASVPMPPSAANVILAPDMTTHSPAAASPLDTLLVALCFVWMAGVLLSAAWLILCRARLAAVCSRAVPPVDLAIREELRTLCDSMQAPCPLLLVSREIASPFVTGVRQPYLVLPNALIELPDGPTRRAVLAHELQHLKAHDVGWTLFGSLFCMLLWPQALLFWLVRRLRDTSEEACDLAALQHNCSPQQYARCLVSIAEAMTWGGPERAAGVGMALCRSSLGRRVEQILKYRTRSFYALTLRSAASVLCLFGLIFLMTFRIIAAGASDQPRVTSVTEAPLATVTEAEPPTSAESPADAPLPPGELTIAVQSSEQDNEALTKQQDRSRRELEQAQRELQKERAEVDRSIVERRQAEAEIAELRARLQSLVRRQKDAAAKNAALAKASATLRGTSEQEDRARQLTMLQRELTDRKASLLQLQRTYTLNHPRMLQAQAAASELQRRIEDYRRSLLRDQGYLSSNATKSDQTLNARRQEALNLERATSLRAELLDREAQVQAQQAELQRAVSQLRVDQAHRANETDMLKAEIAQLKAQLEIYRKQREEAQKTGK